jgi:hypothetical protein
MRAVCVCSVQCAVSRVQCAVWCSGGKAEVEYVCCVVLVCAVLVKVLLCVVLVCAGM